jgi:hypothetical protein
VDPEGGVWAIRRIEFGEELLFHYLDEKGQERRLRLGKRALCQSGGRRPAQGAAAEEPPHKAGRYDDAASSSMDVEQAT